MFREYFRYGAEVVEDNNYILWPTNGKLTALIDADMLPYIVGYGVDEMMYIRAHSRVKSGTHASIIETPEFLDAQDKQDRTLNIWVCNSGSDSAILYLTNSKTNFRLDVAFSEPYKGKRTIDKPPFFKELRESLVSRHFAHISIVDEADDQMSIEMYRRHNEFCEENDIEIGSDKHRIFSDVICCTKDKDAKISAGWNYDPTNGLITWSTSHGSLSPKYKESSKETADYKFINDGFFTRGKNKGKPKNKRIKIGMSKKMKLHKLSGSGLMFFYAQIIMGDVADNYTGLVGKGSSFALNLLDGITTERGLFFAVYDAYVSVYGSGKFFHPHYKGTIKYRDSYIEINGKEPSDYLEWKDKGTMLTAYTLMMEQGRLAWMRRFEGDIWRDTEYCPLTSDPVWKLRSEFT